MGVILAVWNSWWVCRRDLTGCNLSLACDCIVQQFVLLGESQLRLRTRAQVSPSLCGGRAAEAATDATSRRALTDGAETQVEVDAGGVVRHGARRVVRLDGVRLARGVRARVHVLLKQNRNVSVCNGGLKVRGRGSFVHKRACTHGIVM